MGTPDYARQGPSNTTAPTNGSGNTPVPNATQATGDTDAGGEGVATSDQELVGSGVEEDGIEMSRRGGML